MMPGTLHFPVLSCARQPRDIVWLYPCLCVICVTTEMTSYMVRIGSRRVPATSVAYHIDVECRISVVTLGKSNGAGSKQQAHFGKSQTLKWTHLACVLPDMQLRWKPYEY